MKRRDFFVGLGGTAVSSWLPVRSALAQKVPRIGLLGGNSGGLFLAAFARRMEEIGYSDGKNIRLEWRHDNGHPELLPELAADLVRLKVDAIVAVSTESGRVAQKATGEIPIVVLASHDGVGVGLYKSLAHPGGNITGIESMAPSLDVKRVEILKDLLPRLSRVVVLYNQDFAGAKIHFNTISAAAAKLDFNVRFLNISSMPDFEVAFAAILADRPDALLTVADPLIFGLGRKPIVEFEAAQRIPAIHEFKIFVEQGGLISYGPDGIDIFRRGAEYIDKILKGEKPGNIPVEQPTKLDLAINLKTAKALGVTFPDSLVVSANVVIE
jgi:putative tryptophan/tyrosine transport system substrate-binding protein